MPTPAATPVPTACPRCAGAIGRDRRLATALDGGPVCERCQDTELDELIEQLDRAAPGPALPANFIPLADRRRAQTGTSSR